MSCHYCCPMLLEVVCKEELLWPLDRIINAQKQYEGGCSDTFACCRACRPGRVCKQDQPAQVGSSQ